MIEGSLHHVGVATNDLERAVDEYRRTFGLDQWVRLDVAYDAEWQGAPARIEGRVAFAKWGPVYLEVVEGGTTPNPARHWLDTVGEGIYHLAYAADPRQRPFGDQPCFRMLSDPLADGAPQAVYFDTVSVLGYYMELLAPDRAEGLSALVDQAAH